MSDDSIRTGLGDWLFPATRRRADNIDWTIQRRADNIDHALQEIRAQLANGSGTKRSPLPNHDFRDYFGPDHGTALYEKMFGTSNYTISQPQMLNLRSSICRQTHFAYDEYRFWARKVGQAPGFHRKQWEWFFILQALWERGLIRSGARGVGFGVGQEPLPAALASYGVEITATDQSIEAAIEAGWLKTNEHSDDLSALNKFGLCPSDDFQRLVSFETADMNRIPDTLAGRFDFCWSACSLEHLGSLEHGMAFVENSMRVLRPGGVAIHTTEFNVSSNRDTIESTNLSVYRRRDIEELAARLEAKGFVVAELDLEPSDGFVETIVDVPPYKTQPHIRLAIGNYVCTSVGLIVEKSIDA
jgi:SAM-dependent methyltransferase